MAGGVSNNDKAELQRIRKKLDGIRGPGVRHTKESVYIGSPLAQPGKRSPAAASGTVLVAIGGALTPGGLYFGTTLRWQSNTGTGPPNPATSVTNATGVVVAFSEQEVYFLNGPEYGLLLPTHDLSAPTGEAFQMGIGIFSGVTFSDGKPLVIGLGINWSTCSEVTDTGAFNSF